jgi:threonine/homoserine/homoserine lactone efflux protein
LRFLCGAVVVWLALRIARSRSLGMSETEKISKPISFVQGALFQLVNPKAWAVALIVTVSYTTPEDYLAILVLMILLFAMVAVPSMSVWAIFGSALRSSLAKGRRIAVFNVAMAILLVASMAPVILRAG